jgi:hypothetical protein
MLLEMLLVVCIDFIHKWMNTEEKSATKKSIMNKKNKKRIKEIIPLKNYT